MNEGFTSRKRARPSSSFFRIIVTLTVTVAVAMEYTTTVRHHVQRSEAFQTAISSGTAPWSTPSLIGAKSVAATRTPPCITVHSRIFRFPPRLSFPAWWVSGRNARQPTSAGVSPRQFQTSKSSRSIRNCDRCQRFSARSCDWPIPRDCDLRLLGQADVTLPVLGGNVTAKVRRVFQKEQLSPWNWAIFYVDPLEIQPGAPMSVTGGYTPMPASTPGTTSSPFKAR